MFIQVLQQRPQIMQQLLATVSERRRALPHGRTLSQPVLKKSSWLEILNLSLRIKYFVVLVDERKLFESVGQIQFIFGYLDMYVLRLLS